jgi:hypothetical protein
MDQQILPAARGLSGNKERRQMRTVGMLLNYSRRNLTAMENWSQRGILDTEMEWPVKMPWLETMIKLTLCIYQDQMNCCCLEEPGSSVTRQEKHAPLYWAIQMGQ